MSQKKCKSCGTVVSAATTFCMNCGSSAFEAIGAPAAQPRQQAWGTQQPYAQPQQQAWGAQQQAQPQQNAWGAQQQAQPQQNAWGAQQQAQPQQNAWGAQQQAQPQQNAWGAQQQAQPQQNAWGAQQQAQPQQNAWGAQQYTQPAYAQAAAVPEKKGFKPWQIAILAGLAVLLILFVIIGVTSGGGGSGIGSGNINDSINNNVNNNISGLEGNDHVGSVASETKTVMIYMVGSDLESKNGAATFDILEMTESEVDTKDNNIIVYTGGSRAWHLEGLSADKNTILRLDGDEFKIVEEQQKKNMADADTLAEFIGYCTSKYKTDQYSLVLWNHGAGPMYGYGHDELSGDMLSLSEISEALDEGGIGDGLKLEFIGFDACLMGTIEVAWELKDYAEYMIASQETEPGWGWDYSWLKLLDHYDSGEDLGKGIVDSFINTSSKIYDQYPQYRTDVTLSCVDLTKIYDVEQSMDALFSKVDSGIKAGYFSKASQVRYNVKCFGKDTTNDDYDLVDMVHLVSLLAADYTAETQEVINDLKEYVCYSRSTANNASGVSIYHPYDNRVYMDSWVRQFGQVDFSENYTRYISSFAEMLREPGSVSWRSFGSVGGTALKNGAVNELSIKLTQEQVENYAGSSYYILRRIKDDEYLFIFAGFDSKLSSDGTLSATYNNKAVFSIDEKTGTVSDFPITMYQVRDGSNEQKFIASAIFWSFEGDVTDWRVDPVEWQIRIENGVPQAYNAYLIGDDAIENIPQKNLLNYKDYDTVEFSFSSRKPKRDANGNLLPYFEWDSTGTFYGHQYNVETGFRLECREIENNDDYYVMFVVNDIRGNQYASDMFTLPK